MIVFNTFTNYQRVKKLPETDILIWTASLLEYKRLGYRTKLYCEKKDLGFLFSWRLLDLYDEIDTDFLEKSEMLKKIDNKHFWSSRKIEAMWYQLNVLNEPAIYSDTDIIMRAPFDLTCDALVWSPEGWNTNEGQIYVPWRNLSKPAGYNMPEYILNTSDAYNCGILYFKNKDIFNEYREQYYAFALHNPCEVYEEKNDDVDDLTTNNSVWACNAEQRILKAVLDHRRQDVCCVMPERLDGYSEKGSHFFLYRIAWSFLDSSEWTPVSWAIPTINLTIVECLKEIKEKSDTLYLFWLSRPWLKDFNEKLDIEKGIWPVTHYN